MQAVASRQRAGLHAELSQRIRKRERHVDVGEAVIVVAAIEQVIGGVSGAARDGYGLRAEEALAAGIGSIAVIDGCAGDGDELRWVAAIEGQVENTPLVDDL